jgi:NitT/TauT family transport system permease protein
MTQQSPDLKPALASSPTRPVADDAEAIGKGGSSFSWIVPIVLPLLVASMLTLVWDRWVVLSKATLFPRPHHVVLGMIELAQEGLLHRYILASLFRVLWGFALATLVGVPIGLMMGWFGLVYQALNPLIQALRPVSPIAWIPVAILWFGVSEAGPIFLIFLASVFPITVAAAAAVQNIQLVYVRAAQNFGLGRFALFTRVILPATLPQILTGLRIALGIAWLVVVAAEMLVVTPETGGLGYLIIDARNAGSRYDLVVAAMVIIGLIGLLLDLMVRQLETFDEVRWGYSQR